jgi:hypothetical protein
MARAQGGAATRRYIEQLPRLVAERVLPGAARAGAKVIADGAKLELGDRRADGANGSKVLIADSVKVRAKKHSTLIVARVLLQGPGAYVGRWLEYGTSGHFISVDPAYRRGMTARRTNKQIKNGDAALKSTLMINGKPVGTTVYHPGAKKVPFLRPSLDKNQAEAKAAAQSYINARVTRAGIKAGSSIGEDE